MQKGYFDGGLSILIFTRFVMLHVCRLFLRGCDQLAAHVVKETRQLPGRMLSFLAWSSVLSSTLRKCPFLSHLLYIILLCFRMSEEKLEVKESDMEESEQVTVMNVVRESQRLYNVDKVGHFAKISISFTPFPLNLKKWKTILRVLRIILLCSRS